MILSNGMAYMKSPFMMNPFGKPWVMGSMYSMSSTSGLNLGPLLSLLSTSSPLVQVPLFSQATNTRMMGHSMMFGSRMSEWGGHYMLSNVLASLNSQMQPSMQSRDEQRHQHDAVPGLDGPARTWCASWS